MPLASEIKRNRYLACECIFSNLTRCLLFGATCELKNNAARFLMPANGSRGKMKFMQLTINKTTKQGMPARRRRSVNVNSEVAMRLMDFIVVVQHFSHFFSRFSLNSI